MLAALHDEHLLDLTVDPGGIDTVEAHSQRTRPAVRTCAVHGNLGEAVACERPVKLAQRTHRVSLEATVPDKRVLSLLVIGDRFHPKPPRQVHHSSLDER